MTRIGIITQARMTSTRLPGKVLLEVNGSTMLESHIQRLREAAVPIIVATTVNSTDDPIAALTHQFGVPTFRGSEADVLSRFAGAAEAYGLDVVVRVTSDCPLIDGRVVTQGIAEFLRLNDSNAYVSNTMERTFPRGFDFEVFSAETLRDAAASATDPMDREHVTPYINRNRSGRVHMSSVRREIDASQYRVTLDTEEDFTLIRKLIEDHDAANLNGDEIIAVLDRHPDLVRINSQVEQRKVS